MDLEDLSIKKDKSVDVKMNGHYILKLNNKCNMNCIFCADPYNVRNLPDNDLMDIFKGIKENRKKFDSLIITGGEPTIYKNIIKILKYSKKKSRYNRICIVTNGVILSYKDYFEKINELIDSYQISYFASDEKTHNTLSRTRETYKKVIRGIRNAIDTKKEVRINVVINKLNYRQLPQIVEQLIEWKTSSITLAFMNPSGDSVINGKSIVGVSYYEVMPYIKKSFEKAKKLKYGGLFIENFPLCIAREYMDKIADLAKPNENKEYYTEGKIKTKKCDNCNYKNHCLGIWRCYNSQIGDKELTPFIIKKITEKIDDTSKNLINIDYGFLNHLYETAGLELGIKKGSIIYCKRDKIKKYMGELKKKGYKCEVSNFCYIYHDEKTDKIEYPSDEGEYSIYFSKNKDISKRLKYVDYYHQLKKTEPGGLTGHELFYEIGKILGYPKCCSDFLLSCHEIKDYENLMKLSNEEYSDETIYKILAIKKNHKAYYELNNFNINYLKLFGFYVCNYKCQNARKISEKIIEHVMDKYPEEYGNLIKHLKKPILFFSAYRIIFFEKTRKTAGKIFYNKIETDLDAINLLNNEKKRRFDDIIRMFKKGNSFVVESRLIRVYKNNKQIHIIPKKHDYDGIYIEFI